MNRQAWDDARSLLAVRLDGIGDLLMTTPLPSSGVRSILRLPLTS